jgi:hypothetical protein
MCVITKQQTQVSQYISFVLPQNNDDFSSHDVELYHTALVNYQSDMFAGASSFNQDVSNWSVSSGTDFVSVFELAVTRLCSDG